MCVRSCRRAGVLGLFFRGGFSLEAVFFYRIGKNAPLVNEGHFSSISLIVPIRLIRKIQNLINLYERYGYSRLFEYFSPHLYGVKSTFVQAIVHTCTRYSPHLYGVDIWIRSWNHEHIFTEMTIWLSQRLQFSCRFCIVRSF